MHPQLKTLERLEELDRLLAASELRPLLLFKHSHTCGTSVEALDELVAHLNGGPADAEYAMVTVQTHRDVSNEVARKLGVRHETPQALLISNGRVVWSASHFRVTANAVEDAIATTLATNRPSLSPSRSRRISRGATSLRSSPLSSRNAGLVGLPRAACARVKVS